MSVNAKAVAAQVEMQAARVAGFVNAYVIGNTAIASARVSQLQGVQASLSNVPPITKEIWAADWAKQALADLIASGMKDTSAGVTVSRLKMVAMAITNHIKPEASDNFQSFADGCGDKLREKGLLDARKASNVAPKVSTAIEPAEHVAAWFDGEADQSTQTKKLVDTFGDAERAMAFMIVADGSVSLAHVLNSILPAHEAEFRQFAATLLDTPAKPVNTRKRRD